MSDALPKPRVTYMRMSTAKPRKIPKENDLKVSKGVTYIRKQCRDSSGSRLVNGSRPIFDWIKCSGKSKCCSEPMYIERGGGYGAHTSQYYVCTKCKKGCDPE